jgi:hypothetical protein
MALSLTCLCGARFELEDTLAGQTITCPECQQPLKAPALQQAPLRTSNLALLSMILALVGAFTLIGTAAAAVLGLLALAEIARNRDKVAGVGLALFGLIAGVGLTALTAFALFSGEVFGFAANIRELMLADQIDAAGPLEIVDGANGFKIKRPTKKWGVAVKDIENPLLQGLLRDDAHLLLVKSSPYVFLDVHSEGVNGRTMEECKENILAEYQVEPEEEPWMKQARPRRPGARRTVNPENNPFKPTRYFLQQKLSLPIPQEDADKVAEVLELRLEVSCVSRNWPFVIRLIKTKMGKLYVVRAFTPTKKFFKEAEAEIEEALDSFRVLPGN